jgi:hypothetical protein
MQPQIKSSLRHMTPFYIRKKFEKKSINRNALLSKTYIRPILTTRAVGVDEYKKPKTSTVNILFTFLSD